MEKEINTLSEEAIRMMAPLSWAFIGDAVFEILARTQMLAPGRKPQVLHRMTSQVVSARGQTAFYETIKDELTDEEATVFRRGRNGHSATMAKNMTVQEYRTATGLEALFGYLYLLGRKDRILELFSLGIKEEEDAR